MVAELTRTGAIESLAQARGTATRGKAQWFFQNITTNAVSKVNMPRL